MFTYCQSFQRTSTFNIFKSQFVLCNNCEEQRRDLSDNNCTAIISIINLLKVQFPGICYSSIEPKLVLYH